MGICVSYDRVLELEDWIASSVCERFEEDGVVIPAYLRKEVFIVGALDNLDTTQAQPLLFMPSMALP